MFDITADDIANLNDEDLRELVARLCVAECRSRGFPAEAVSFGGDQRAPDGGIDVRVSLPEGSEIEGYIPCAETGFQIKATDMPKGRILEEMKPKGCLRKSIADLGVKNGAYIIASSKDSVADKALADRKRAMAQAAESIPDEHSLKLDFYDRTKLATWTNQHPGVVLWVREKCGRAMDGWKPYQDWSSSPSREDAEYLCDDTVRIHGHQISEPKGCDAVADVGTIRRVLSKEKSSVRLTGLSGVGKTRFAQALFDERLGEDALDKQLAVYTDISHDPEPPPIRMISRLNANGHKAIVVVDNCSPELHKQLTREIKSRTSKISLLTVEYDITDDEFEGTDLFHLEPSSGNLIEKIIEEHYPELDKPTIAVVAEFSGGNARVALALAGTVDKSESIVSLRDGDLFERLFHQRKDKDRTLLKAAEVCSLLYSFEGESFEGKDAELPMLANLVGQPSAQLYRHVVEMSRRKVVQERGKWRAVLPHAIANYLAKRALENIPLPLIEAHIINGGSERVLKSFSKRLGYLHEVTEARDIASCWLTEDGRIGPLEKLGQSDLELFLFKTIAPVNQEASLRAIERAASKSRRFTTEKNRIRSDIVSILRSLAYEPTNFDRAVAQLIGFARDESIDDGNAEATKVLCSLCSLFLLGTLAQTEQRAKVIRGLLGSDDELNNRIGLTMLEAMMQAQPSWTSFYNVRFGVRHRSPGWYPDIQEQQQWYVSAIDLGRAFALSGKPLAPRARVLIGDYLWKMLRFCEKSVRVRVLEKVEKETADQLLDNGDWPEGWLALRQVLVSDMTDMPAEFAGRVETLAGRLAPANLETRIRAYVVMAPRDIKLLDIDVEIGSLADKGSEGERNRVKDKCIAFGREFVNDPQLLETLLPEILTATSSNTYAGNSWALGQGIALECASLLDTWSLLSHVASKLDPRQLRPELLGGFLCSAFDRDPGAIETISDSLLADGALRKHFVYLVTCNRRSKNEFARILSSFDYKDIPVCSYCAYVPASSSVSPPTLLRYFRRLLDKEGGSGVAEAVFGSYVSFKEQSGEPFHSVDRKIGRLILSKTEFTRSGNQYDRHRHFSEIIKVACSGAGKQAYARKFGERLLAAILDNNKTSTLDRDHEFYGGAIAELAKLFPKMVLDVFVETAARQPSEELYLYFVDLYGVRQRALEHVSADTLTSWARNGNPERFTQLADAICFFETERDEEGPQWTASALELVKHASDRILLLETFFKRFKPGSESSTEIAERMEECVVLLDQLARFEGAEVSAWVAEKRSELRELIDAERSRYENRRDRDRDERFE